MQNHARNVLKSAIFSTNNNWNAPPKMSQLIIIMLGASGANYSGAAGAPEKKRGCVGGLPPPKASFYVCRGW